MKEYTFTILASADQHGPKIILQPKYNADFTFFSHIFLTCCSNMYLYYITYHLLVNVNMNV